MSLGSIGLVQLGAGLSGVHVTATNPLTLPPPQPLLSMTLAQPLGMSHVPNPSENINTPATLEASFILPLWAVTPR